MTNFNWIDYTVLGIFFLSMVVGLMRGLLKEVISVLSWVAGFIVASIFAAPLAAMFTSSPQVQSTFSSASTTMGVKTTESVSMLAMSVSFVLIFIGVIILGKIISFFMTSIFEGKNISFANRFFGALFGLVRGGLITLLIMFIVDFSPLSKQPAWESSQFVASFAPMVEQLQRFVEPRIHHMKEKMSETMQTYGQKLNNLSY